MAHLTKDPSARVRWICFYPVYIDSTKTLEEGRRIAKESACRSPTCPEIFDACTKLKLPVDIEPNKAYPRDYMLVGRLRVQLKNADGSLVNKDIPSRKELMVKVAEAINKIPGRAEKFKQADAAAKPAPAPAQSSKKKKGKK
eukprot:Colp12_sorted_trinity150504_noHs@5807